jgi:hypothetical protein
MHLILAGFANHNLAARQGSIHLLQWKQAVCRGAPTKPNAGRVSKPGLLRGQVHNTTYRAAAQCHLGHSLEPTWITRRASLPDHAAGRCLGGDSGAAAFQIYGRAGDWSAGEGAASRAATGLAAYVQLAAPDP